MYKNILVPLENSATDRIILEHIKPLAKLTEARLLLIHVADGFVARNQEGLNLSESEEMVNDQNYLEQCCKELASEGYSTSFKLLCGEPAKEIDRVATDSKCDLIAMATHGHRFVGDLILGSVANELRHLTAIPILMVRAPKND